MFRVLCLDGGGIRGVFSAEFLRRLEADVGSLHNHFDMVVGTSTGGIIALAVAFEVPMREAVDLYSSRAAKIFPQPRFSSFYRPFLRPFWAKYSNSPLLRELKAIFGPDSLFDHPSCHVRIQAYDLMVGRSKIFRAGGSFRDHSDLNTWQIAAATSAAPTYFPTFDIPDKGIYVDGGVWANNPTLVGIAEALRLRKAPNEIRLLSIGTGTKIQRTPRSRSGLISWWRYLIDTTFRSHGDGMHQLAHGCNLGHYMRIEETLQKNEAALDATGAISTLKGLANEWYEQKRDEIRTQFAVPVRSRPSSRTQAEVK